VEVFGWNACNALCDKAMQLPSGAMVTEEHSMDIRTLIRFIHEHATTIRNRAA
jgi:hypothetical protein